MAGEEEVITVFDGFDFVVPEGAAKAVEVPSEKTSAESNVSGDVDEEEVDAGQGDSQEEEGGSKEGDEKEGLLEDSEAPGEEEDPEEAALAALAEEAKKKTSTGAGPRKIKAKNGEAQIEVEESATFDQKVDGEVKQVTLRQLLDSYSSSQANQKNYRKFESERKAWEGQVQQFNQVISNFTKQVRDGAAVPAVMDLIRAAGVNPLETVRALREALIKDARPFIEASEEKRQVIYDREEAEFLRNENQRFSKLEQERRQSAEREAAISRAMDAYGIEDRREFEDTIVKAQAHFQRLHQEQGGQGDVPITADLVGKYYRAEKLRDSFHAALAEKAPHVKEGTEEYEKLAELVIKNNLKPEAVGKLITKIYGKGVSQNRRAEQGRLNGSSKPGEKKTKRAELESVDPGLDIDATPNLSGIDLSEVFG